MYDVAKGEMLMQYLSEFIAFALGLVIMYFFNYFQGYATEKGRQRASGMKMQKRITKDKERIYDYVKQKSSPMFDIKELNDKLFQNKKEIEYLDDLLHELQYERKVRNIKLDGFIKEEQKWRFME